MLVSFALLAVSPDLVGGWRDDWRDGAPSIRDDLFGFDELRNDSFAGGVGKFGN